MDFNWECLRAKNVFNGKNNLQYNLVYLTHICTEQHSAHIESTKWSNRETAWEADVLIHLLCAVSPIITFSRRRHAMPSFTCKLRSRMCRYIYKNRSKYGAKEINKILKAHTGWQYQVYLGAAKSKLWRSLDCGCQNNRGEVCVNENANISSAVRAICLTIKHRPPHSFVTVIFHWPIILVVCEDNVWQAGCRPLPGSSGCHRLVLHPCGACQPSVYVWWSHAFLQTRWAFCFKKNLEGILLFHHSKTAV